MDTFTDYDAWAKEMQRRFPKAHFQYYETSTDTLTLTYYIGVRKKSRLPFKAFYKHSFFNHRTGIGKIR